MKPFVTWALLVCTFPLLLQSKSAMGQQKRAGASVAGSSVPLDAKNCRPATPEQKKWVGGEWTPFERYEIVCPLHTRAGAIALYVLSVNAYDIEQALPPDAPAPKLPKADIVTPQGHIVGNLPFAFPFDAPVSLDVAFTDWNRGMFQTVELFLEDPAVGGNKKLPPLKWNEKLGRYTETGIADGK